MRRITTLPESAVLCWIANRNGSIDIGSHSGMFGTMPLRQRWTGEEPEREPETSLNSEGASNGMAGIGERNWRRELASLKQSAPSLAALTFAVFVPVLLIARTLDRELMMMAFSVMFLVGASLAAVSAWLVNSKRNSQSLSLWDVAGGFAISGCAASVMAEPEHAAQLFEHLFERRSDSK